MATATSTYDEAMTTRVVALEGHGGDAIHAYVAEPTGDGPFPAVVVVHHMPGWDRFSKEMARTFAAHGYLAVCPDLYSRYGEGPSDDIAAAARADGGVPDDQVVADLEAGAAFLRSLPSASGKVGIIGPCSGGRHAYLAACRSDAYDAVVDLWGGGVAPPADQLTEKRPVAPIDHTDQLSIPLLGLFGEDDQSPPMDQVERHRAELERLGKDFEFHTYAGAGHGFFYYDRPAMYRAEQAVDGWQRVWAFFDRTLR